MEKFYFLRFRIDWRFSCKSNSKILSFRKDFRYRKESLCRCVCKEGGHPKPGTVQCFGNRRRHGYTFSLCPGRVESRIFKGNKTLLIPKNDSDGRRFHQVLHHGRSSFSPAFGAILRRASYVRSRDFRLFRI